MSPIAANPHLDSGVAVSPPDIAPLTLADLQEVLVRRWLVALVCALVAGVACIAATRSITPLYEARAVLTIDMGPRALEFQRDNDGQRVEINMLNTIRDQIVAVPVLRRVLAESDVKDQPAYQRAVDPLALLRDRVKATTAKDSLSISLSLRDESPERAITALETLISAYQGTLLAAKNDKSQNAVLFLREQAAAERLKLEDARKAETEFINLHNLVSINPDNNPLSQRLVQLNLQLVEVEGRLAAGAATWRLLDSLDTAAAPERLAGLLSIDEVARQVTVAEQLRGTNEFAAQVAALEAKYGPNHTRLAEARQAQADRHLLIVAAVESAAAVLRRNQGALTEHAAILRSHVAEQEERLKEHRNRLLELSSLGEVTESRNRLYQVVLSRLNEMEVQGALDEKRTKTIDPPTASSKPVNVKQGLFLGVAALVAIVAGIGAALAVESFDTRLQGAKQIQKIARIPMLGAIPSTRKFGPLGRHGDPEQPHYIAEAFRHLRAAVRLARRNPSGCERLAILSCTPGEGKSTVSSRLAISLAAMGARVLLVDADMRKPTQDDLMGEHTERGLSLLLADEPGIRPIATVRPNLDYLGVGVIPPNPGELLLSPRLGEVLNEYSANYDYILIDTPPLSLVADAMSIAEHIDGLILVLRDGHTDKDMLRLVLSRLGPVAHKLNGFVLNGDRSRAAGYYGKKYELGYGSGRPAAATAPATATAPPAPSDGGAGAS